MELPENLLGDKSEIIVAAGIMWCHEFTEGLLYPVEAVCRKVEIPGVRYRDDDDGSIL